jgi:hypothetical protein
MLPKDFMSKSELENVRELQIECGDTRRPYHFEGRTIPWESDIPPDLVQAMKEDSEIACVLNQEGTPHCFLLWEPQTENWRSSPIDH